MTTDIQRCEHFLFKTQVKNLGHTDQGQYKNFF